MKNKLIENENSDYELNHVTGKFKIRCNNVLFQPSKKIFKLELPNEYRYVNSYKDIINIDYVNLSVEYVNLDNLMHDVINFCSVFKLVNKDLLELNKYKNELKLESKILKINKLLIIKKVDYEKCFIQSANEPKNTGLFFGVPR